MTPSQPRVDMARAHRLALIGVVVSAALAVLNVGVGLVTLSTSVLAIGVEFAGDVLASTLVLIGLRVASRPADENHPYGHGRAETIAGLLVGIILVLGGAGITYRSLAAMSEIHPAPGRLALAALIVAIVARTIMSTLKFRAGRRVGSTSLVADAWNDAVDILSALAALVAVALARLDPERFLRADHYGGVCVGLVVIVTGMRVARDASLALADTMPDSSMTDELRRVVASVDGVLGVEQQRARKTGLQYHVDVHIEVDPQLTVQASHEIAHAVKSRVRRELAWVADVLVHVEPAPDGPGRG